MTEPIKLAKELKEEIEKLPLFIEYENTKTLIENDSEIQCLKVDIARAKKNNDLKLHKTLLEKYNNHPLVMNYRTLQQEVYEYLKQVSDIVNKK